MCDYSDEGACERSIFGCHWKEVYDGHYSEGYSAAIGRRTMATTQGDMQDVSQSLVVQIVVTLLECDVEAMTLALVNMTILVALYVPSARYDRMSPGRSRMSSFQACDARPIRWISCSVTTIDLVFAQAYAYDICSSFHVVELLA